MGANSASKYISLAEDCQDCIAAIKGGRDFGGSAASSRVESTHVLKQRIDAIVLSSDPRSGIAQQDHWTSSS